MTFGGALLALERGVRVSRGGWNGKGMFLLLVETGHFDANVDGGEPGKWQTGIPLLPFIVMRTVQGTFVPWLASQTDVLAMDWEVLP